MTFLIVLGAWGVCGIAVVAAVQQVAPRVLDRLLEVVTR